MSTFSHCQEIGLPIHWDMSHNFALLLLNNWAAPWENQQCGFRTGPTQTGLYKHRKELEAWNFGFKYIEDCTIRVAKTKALISFAVTAKLICVFVFAYADCWFSHEAAQMISLRQAAQDTVGITHSVNRAKCPPWYFVRNTPWASCLTKVSVAKFWIIFWSQFFTILLA